MQSAACPWMRVEKAKSGHPGLPMGAADIATVLFTRFLKFESAEPGLGRSRPVRAVGRPRFHAAVLVAASHRLRGRDARRTQALPPARLPHARAPGIPPHARCPRPRPVLSARASPRPWAWRWPERILAAEFGPQIVDHRTYVLASDGDLMEGISQEAIALAGPPAPVAPHGALRRQRHFHRRTAVAVRQRRPGEALRGRRLAGPSASTDTMAEATGRRHRAGAGLGPSEPHRLQDHHRLRRPPSGAGTSKAHGEPLGAEELAGAKLALNLSPEPFSVPADVLAVWREAGARSRDVRSAWEKRLAALDPAQRAEFERRMAGALPQAFPAAVAGLKAKLSAEPQTIATPQGVGARPRGGDGGRSRAGPRGRPT